MIGKTYFSRQPQDSMFDPNHEQPVRRERNAYEYMRRVNLASLLEISLSFHTGLQTMNRA